MSSTFFRYSSVANCRNLFPHSERFENVKDQFSTKFTHCYLKLTLSLLRIVAEQIVSNYFKILLLTLNNDLALIIFNYFSVIIVTIKALKNSSTLYVSVAPLPKYIWNIFPGIQNNSVYTNAGHAQPFLWVVCL